MKRVSDFCIDTTDKVLSCPGERYHVERATEVRDDGSLHLHQVGKTDSYAMIQSFKDSVDINVILQRYANGDESALARRQALYFDASDIPDTYVGMINRLNQARLYFDSLPTDEKEKFDNSWEKWLSTFDHAEKSGFSKPVVDKPVIEKPVVTPVIEKEVETNVPE